MVSFSLKKFTNPDLLKTIAPGRLVAFLNGRDRHRRGRGNRGGWWRCGRLDDDGPVVVAVRPAAGVDVAGGALGADGGVAGSMMTVRVLVEVRPVGSVATFDVSITRRRRAGRGRLAPGKAPRLRQNRPPPRGDAKWTRSQGSPRRGHDRKSPAIRQAGRVGSLDGRAGEGR